MVEENSQIPKLIRDPMFPRLTCLVIAFFQLVIITTSFIYYAFILSIIMSILTFLTSLAVIVILGTKKSEAFANCCLFKRIVGKPELSWNSVYFTYTLAFACLNLMTIPATLYRGRYDLVVILGGILMVVYLLEACKAFTQIDWHRWGNINKDPRKYVRLLKFIGRFPVLTNMLIAILSAVLIVVDRLTDPSWNYYSYSYYFMPSDKFTIFFAAGVLFVLSLMNIITMKFKCIQSKLNKNNIQHYKIKYIFTLIMTAIAFVGFIVSLLGPFFDRIEQFPFTTLVAAVVFVFSLFISLSEAHAKWEEPNSSDDRNSILPKSLPKNVLNPVVTDELKTPAGLDGADPVALV